MGAIEKLICWENLEIVRYTLKKSDGSFVYKNLRPDQEKDKANFIDPEVSEVYFIYIVLVLDWNGHGNRVVAAFVGIFGKQLQNFRRHLGNRYGPLAARCSIR